jgi:hypothetical protein
MATFREMILDFARKDVIPTSVAETREALGAMFSFDRDRLFAAEGTLAPELLASIFVIPGAIQALRDVVMDVRAGDTGWLTALSVASVIPLFGPGARGARRAANRFMKIADERLAARTARSPQDAVEDLRRAVAEEMRPRAAPGHTPTVDDITYQQTMGALASAWGSSNPHLLRQELANVARIVRETPPEQLVREATSTPQIVRETTTQTQRFRQAALRASRAAKESPGATVNPRTGENVTSGYAVSPHKNREAVLSRRPTFDDIQKYMEDNADIFANENAHFGLWLDEDTGQWFMDVTEVRPTLWEAATLGYDNAQKAIFHIDELEEILLPQAARQVLPNLQNSTRREDMTRQILNQFQEPGTFDPVRSQQVQKRLRRQRRRFGDPARVPRAPVNLIEESRNPVLYDDGTPTGRERVTWRDPDTPGLVVKGTVDGQDPTVLHDALVDSRRVGDPAGATPQERWAGGVGSLGHGKARALREAITSRGFTRVNGWRVGGTLAGPAVDPTRGQGVDKALSALAGIAVAGDTVADEDGNELPFLGMFIAAVGGNPNAVRVFRSGLTRPARKLYDALLADELEVLHTSRRSETAGARHLETVARLAPSERQLQSAALAGHEGRGFYRRGSKVFVDMFGPEAPRFAALLASLSPQTDVKNNLEMALAAWGDWVRLPRDLKKDPRAIEELLHRAARTGNTGTGDGTMMASRLRNATEVLMEPDPLKIRQNLTLSGPKVNSFFPNLVDEVDRATIDGWMNRLPREQLDLEGVSRHVGGRRRRLSGGQYAGFGARFRNTASSLGERTGIPWDTENVQETGWAWARAIDDAATANHLTDDFAQAVPLVTPQAVRETSFLSGQIPELLAGPLARQVREAGLSVPDIPPQLGDLTGGLKPRVEDLEELARNIQRSRARDPKSGIPFPPEVPF